MAVTYGNSWVDICNRALGRLGTGTIQSLTTEVVNKENARFCALYLGEAIDTVYSQFDWASAIAKVELARLVAEPINGADYAYQLPGDLIRVISVDADGEDYSLVGETVETDAETVYLEYVQRPSDPAKIPGYLKKALSTTLAFVLTTPLTSNENMANRIAGEMQIAIERAKTDEQAGKQVVTQEDELGVVWYDQVR